MLAVGATLVVLLPVLAWLQYRWLGQVSAGERDRMQSNLNTAAREFSKEFNREIARAYVYFNISEAVPIERVWVEGKERFELWRSSPYSSLVDRLFVADQPILYCYRPEEDRFEPVDWPSGFDRLRQKLTNTNGSLSSSGASVMAIPAVPVIEEEIPALVMPVPVQSRGTGQDSVRLAYVVVQLNLDYLQSEFFPALISGYFFGQESSEYNLAIVSKSRPGRVIYSSTPGAANEDSSSGDAVVALLDIQFEDLLSISPDVSNAAKSLNTSQGQFARFAIRMPSTASSANGSSGTPQPRISGAWLVVFKHKAGSIRTAVDRARLRNLIISFGIVLLLGASVVMFVLTTSRAHRLAKQQLEFVAGVSHELRTPVSVICSAAENLADGLVGDRQQAMKYGMVIQNEGRRLADMVEQVLELAGIQSQRRGYEFRPQTASALVGDALESLELQIVKGGFRIETAIEPDLPPIKADAAAIRRAIQNLVANAMKYGGGQKWVGIKVEKNDDGTDASVRLTVEDRGIGIPPDELPYIFEAFFRGRTAITDQIAGSGLGLSLVRNIIDAHAGRITVHSVVGGGTAFTLYLPAARTVEPVSEEA